MKTYTGYLYTNKSRKEVFKDFEAALDVLAEDAGYFTFLGFVLNMRDEGIVVNYGNDYVYMDDGPTIEKVTVHE